MAAEECIRSVSNDTIFKRNSLWIQPSLKIYYTIKFRNKNNFEIIPFAGYYCFGGKSKTEPDGYKDIYSFKSIEIGVIPTFILKNKLELSPSIKGQYIISVIGMYYGSLGQSGSLPRKWEKEDYSNSYSKTALSAGIKAKYKIFKKFSIGVETWFGITNMFLNTNNYFKISVTENNYRMFIGYEL